MVVDGLLLLASRPTFSRFSRKSRSNGGANDLNVFSPRRQHHRGAHGEEEEEPDLHLLHHPSFSFLSEIERDICVDYWTCFLVTGFQLSERDCVWGGWVVGGLQVSKEGPKLRQVGQVLGK